MVKISSKIKMFTVAFLVILAFVAGIHLSPIVNKVEVPVPNEELQQSIRDITIRYIKQFQEEGFEVGVVDYWKYVKVNTIYAGVNSVELFLALANTTDVDIIYVTYKAWTVDLPIFWFTYYSESSETGSVVSWSPFA